MRLTPSLSAVIDARTTLARWEQQGRGDVAASVIAAEQAVLAPKLVVRLLERSARLEYLLGRLLPADCTCDIDGPDGIECLRCEVLLEMEAESS